ncbi:MAG TPA: hypothetical protein DCY89_10195 [Gammaproteobacteria bacterium]|nr:hypothetical protein [Gammaproteobacteria bacterium]
MNRRSLPALHRSLFVLLAACWVASAAAAEAPSLGRLFSTPEERARLDEARRQARLPAWMQMSPEEGAVAAPPGPPEPPPPPPPRGTLAVDGYVLRGDGATTVWVNREGSTGGPLLGVDAAVEPPGRAGVGARVLAPDGTSVLLRPGQSLPAGETEVREGYLLPTPEPPTRAVTAPVAPGAGSPRGTKLPVGRQ